MASLHHPFSPRRILRQPSSLVPHHRMTPPPYLRTVTTHLFSAEGAAGGSASQAASPMLATLFSHHHSDSKETSATLASPQTMSLPYVLTHSLSVSPLFSLCFRAFRALCVSLWFARNLKKSERFRFKFRFRQGSFVTRTGERSGREATNWKNLRDEDGVTNEKKETLERAKDSPHSFFISHSFSQRQRESACEDWRS